MIEVPMLYVFGSHLCSFASGIMFVWILVVCIRPEPNNWRDWLLLVIASIFGLIGSVLMLLSKENIVIVVIRLVLCLCSLIVSSVGMGQSFEKEKNEKKHKKLQRKRGKNRRR